MIEIFLIIMGIIWIVFASISDLRKREVPNWLSFSLIAFALVYRVIFSVINSDLWYLINGLIGLVVFIALGYGFYYGRVFAGGDAKLFMGLGAILPVSSSLISNLFILGGFIFLLLLFGSLWGIAFSLNLIFQNTNKFLKEFLKQFKLNKKMLYLSILAVSLVFIIVLIFRQYILGFLSLIILFFPILYIYAKSTEESCMIKEVLTKNLVEGDWMYEGVRVKGRKIEPSWEGLSLKDIEILKKYRKKIKVKEGIPFVPAFFFAFIALFYLLYFRLDVINMFF